MKKSRQRGALPQYGAKAPVDLPKVGMVRRRHPTCVAKAPLAVLPHSASILNILSDYLINSSPSSKRTSFFTTLPSKFQRQTSLFEPLSSKFS